MKKIILKTVLFTLPFFLLSSYHTFGDSMAKGDLKILGDIIEFEDYDRTLIFPKDFTKECKFINYSQLNSNFNFDVFTIGDSFSDQGTTGYQNFLADNNQIKILNFDRNLYDSPIDGLYSVLNGDLLKKVKVKYIVLEGVERDLNVNIINLDTIKIFNIEKPKVEIEQKITTQEEKSKNEVQKVNNFFTKTLFVSPYKNILYNFQDRPLFSQTYKVKTNSNLFSIKENDLLFYFEDIEHLQYNNDPKNVIKLNNQLNILSKKLNDRGIKLIFLPAPDKYDLYYSDIKDKSKYPEPLFFTMLDTLKKDYLYLNSKKILLEAKKKYKDVYFYDDTHWSPIAAKLIALELDKLITKN